MLKLYDFGDSGNGYKVRLLAALLGIPLEVVPVDIVAGASRSKEFLRKNPNGRIPVLELPDGRTLPESNAILLFLGEGSSFIPVEPFARARMFAWLFFEQYSHESFVATSRYILRHLPPGSARHAELPERQARGREALGVMESTLEKSDYFAPTPSLADLALFAYTHVAPEGGIDLGAFPAVRAWLERITRLPGFVSMG